ncbi:MAG: hypothetical protein SFW35_00425 [Chitinophagales bacterium]|nr:hypothetical protein [Chitinophagales bacterium]
MEIFIDTTKQLLNDLATVLEQLDNEAYSAGRELFSGSSIGQHTRHILEFYQCLLSQLPTGTIDYDLRKRNIEIECSVQKALEVIQTLIETLPENNATLWLNVHLSNPDLNHPASVASNYQRELLYNIEHAIHHMAIIKIGIKHYLPSIAIEESFGVAPSTLRYREACAH